MLLLLKNLLKYSDTIQKSNVASAPGLPQTTFILSLKSIFFHSTCIHFAFGKVLIFQVMHSIRKYFYSPNEVLLPIRNADACPRALQIRLPRPQCLSSDSRWRTCRSFSAAGSRTVDVCVRQSTPQPYCKCVCVCVEAVAVYQRCHSSSFLDGLINRRSGR